MESKLFMGCDLAQDTFNFCLRDHATILLEGKVTNSQTAIRKWINELTKKHRVDLGNVTFCMEHTGIYGLILMKYLHERSLLVSVEGAMNIKLSLGLQRGKNDKVDAKRIAEYAMRYTDRLKYWKPKRAVLEKLQLLNGARARLVKSRTILSRHGMDLKRFMGKEAYQLHKKHTQMALDGIERNIKSVDKQIADLINQDENLQRLSKLITSVSGVGMVTCSAILVRSNEFKDYTEAKKFACTVGLAPFEHTSGTSVKGKTRVSHHAHKDLKTILHMCALGCIRRKGELKDYYERKVASGKNKMSAINAVRYKLIQRVFAVVRTGVMYDKNFQYNLVLS